MDRSTINKMQHQFWVTKQAVYRKLGKKEDECIVASDATLDAKLELFKSIQSTSSAMNKILDRYQERICYLAQEENAMGRFLKEFGKADKSAAGKMMIQMGKSLIYSSQQEITIRPPLLRLYQEVETFRNRAVEDTLETIHHMERNRTEYRAALNWMKNVSQELDPDTYKHMEKFRKVQNHVKMSKSQFDKLKLACLQKVDLLAAARCNMFSHALILYQSSSMKTYGKNAKIFRTLATTFKGHQYFEFSVVKELAEPSKQLAEESGAKLPTDELLFDFNDEVKEDGSSETKAKKPTTLEGVKEKPMSLLDEEMSSESACLLLDNLLGSGKDGSPEAAMDALDFSIPPELEKKNPKNQKTKGKKEKKENEKKDLLTDDLLFSEDFDGMISPPENDTMALLQEILDAQETSSNFGNLSLGNQMGSQPLIPTTSEPSTSEGGNISNLKPQTPQLSSFLPSQLLDFGNLDIDGPDLLNFTGPPLPPPLLKRKEEEKDAVKSWYDIFADLDPIANPDTIAKKDAPEEENRYC